MPFFKNYPPAKSVMVEQGWPVYLFGSRQSIDSELYVTSVAITTNVATVGVTSWSGPLPVVGAYVSIQGTQTNSGLFNVTNLPITAVTLNANQNDVVSISFALTNANIGTTADVGKVHVRFAPVGDAITTAGGASIAGSVGNAVSRDGNWLSVSVAFTGVSAATVVLQGSNTNNDADFQTLQTITLTSLAGQAQVETSFEFVRFLVSGVTGTGTVWATVNA